MQLCSLMLLSDRSKIEARDRSAKAAQRVLVPERDAHYFGREPELGWCSPKFQDTNSHQDRRNTESVRYKSSSRDPIYSYDKPDRRWPRSPQMSPLREQGGSFRDASHDRSIRRIRYSPSRVPHGSYSPNYRRGRSPSFDADEMNGSRRRPFIGVQTYSPKRRRNVSRSRSRSTGLHSPPSRHREVRTVGISRLDQKFLSPSSTRSVHSQITEADGSSNRRISGVAQKEDEGSSPAVSKIREATIKKAKKETPTGPRNMQTRPSANTFSASPALSTIIDPSYSGPPGSKTEAAGSEPRPRPGIDVGVRLMTAGHCTQVKFTAE